MEKFYTSLGLMSGTSMDGVDASVIKSDGENNYEPIFNKYFEYDEEIYSEAIDLWHNNKYLNILEKNGLVISGLNTELNLVEIIELKNHPWFVGVQFHPELKSRVLKPNPLFKDFLAASVNYYDQK